VPRAWATLAAVWVAILAVNLSLRDNPGTVVANLRAALTASPRGFAAAKAFVVGADRQSLTLPETESPALLVPRPRSRSDARCR